MKIFLKFSDSRDIQSTPYARMASGCFFTDVHKKQRPMFAKKTPHVKRQHPLTRFPLHPLKAKLSGVYRGWVHKLGEFILQSSAIQLPQHCLQGVKGESCLRTPYFEKGGVFIANIGWRMRSQQGSSDICCRF